MREGDRLDLVCLAGDSSRGVSMLGVCVKAKLWFRRRRGRASRHSRRTHLLPVFLCALRVFYVVLKSSSDIPLAHIFAHVTHASWAWRAERYVNTDKTKRLRYHMCHISWSFQRASLLLVMTREKAW